MKHFFKKGLSLFLAVLMVVSMLPMDAMAVAFLSGEDEPARVEEPVLDVGEPIVDTMAGQISRGDDGHGAAIETPDPDIGEGEDHPANPSWVNGSVKATINPDGTWKVTMSSDATTTDSSAAWGVALIPAVSRTATTPAAVAATLNGSNTETVEQLQGNIEGPLKLTAGKDFVITGGDTASGIYPDSSGNFVVESNPNTKLPTFEYLQKEFPGISLPVEVVVIFFTKGSGAEQPDGGVGTHVKTTTAEYGQDPKGVPSTTYILNKTSNTLTFVSGSIGTTAWNPKNADGSKVENNTVVSSASVTTDHGTWTAPISLSVPIYNSYPCGEGKDYPQGVVITVTSPTLPSGVTGGTVNDQIMEGTTPAQLNVGASSGTIILPVSVDDPDGGHITDATVTIFIITGTVAPVVFDLDYGDMTVLGPKSLSWADASMTTEAVTDVETGGALMADSSAPDATAEGYGITFALGGEFNWTEVADMLVDPDDPDATAEPYPANYIISTTGGDSATVSLDPDDGSGAFRAKLTVGRHEDGIVVLQAVDRETNALQDDEGNPISAPIIINVYGGKATFHPKTGNPKTVQGKPNGRVTADNVDANSTLPDLTPDDSGKTIWGFSKSGPALTPDDIVMAGRNGNYDYYEVEKAAVSTVKFDPKDTTTIPSQTGTPGTAATAPTGYTVNSTKKTIGGKSYVFKGWSTSDVTPGATATTTNTFTFPADGLTQTYYGVWAQLYGVTYANAGSTYPQIATLPSDTTQYESGQSHTVTANDPAESTNSAGLAFTFDGWQSAGAASDAKVKKGGSVTFASSDITLTATWVPVMQKVTFKYSDGTTADKVVNNAVQKGDDYSITEADPTWTGHTFTGWSVTGGTASATPLKTGGSVNDVTGDVVLTANWDLNKVKVKYDLVKTFAASVLTAPGDESVNYGSDCTLSTDISTTNVYETTDNLGWIFKGWSATPNPAATATPITQVENVTTETTVYAIWAPKEYTVTFRPNGGANLDGTNANKVETVQHGDTVGTLPTATRAGYGFDKWIIDGKTPTTEFTTAYVVTENLNVDATWTAQPGTAKIIVLKDGAAYAGITVTLYKGTTSTSYTGTSAADGTISIANVPGGTYNIYVGTTDTQVDVVVPLGAESDQAQVDYFTVTAKTGTGAATATSSATVVLKGTTGVTLGGSAATYYDESTAKWTPADGSADFATGSTASTLNATLAAINSKSEYTLSFEKLKATMTYTKGNLPNTVSGLTLPNQETVDHGTSYTVKAPTATPAASTGWKFNDWKEGATTYVGGTDAINPVVGSHTFDAQWQVQVSFDLNNTGTGYTDLAPNTLAAPAARWENHGSTMTAATLNAIAPTGGPSSNYSFAGWSTTPGKDQTVVSANQTFNAPVTYYAQWTEKGGDAKVTIKVDGSVDNTGITSVKVNNKELTLDSADNTWKTSGGALKAGTYNVFVNGTDTNISITVPKGDTGTATVEYFTVTANKGTGAATATVSAAKVLKGTTGVKLNGSAATYYDVTTAKWTKVSGAGFATGSTASTLNATLDAINEKTEYTLSFDSLTNTVDYAPGVATGATINPAVRDTVKQTDTSYTVKSSNIITGADPGWQFREWNEAANGSGTGYAGSGAATISGHITVNKTLTAQWQVQVSFDLNNTGTGYTDLAPNTLAAPIAQWENYGSTMTAATLNAIAPTGGPSSNYSFAGWSTTPGKDQTVVSANQTFNAPVTYYAQWTEKGGDAQVTIKVDGSVDNTGITSVTVNGKGLTLDTDNTWKTSDGAIKAGTYNVFVNGADTNISITVPKGDTGTATVEYFTVTANVGTGAATATVSAAKVLKGTTGVKLNGSAATYYDVTTAKWTKVSGADFASGSTASTLNAELAAINEKTEYTLSFSKLKAEMKYERGDLPTTVSGFTLPAPNPEEVDQGTRYVVKAPQATPDAATGWNFDNWKEGSTTYVGGTDAVDPVAGGHTFTAQWTVNVTFDAHIPTGEDTAAGNPNGVTSPGVKKASYGKKLAAGDYPGNLSALQNYTFAGWFDTDAATGGNPYDANSTYTAPITLYARWTPKQYTVSFVDNSGDTNNPADEANKDYNSTITLPASDGDKVGYTFDKWYHDNGVWTSPAGAVGADYTVTKTETLYGHWTPAAVSITYTTAHGNAPTETTAYKYDQEYTVRGEDEITGKNTGDGWNAAGDVFTEGTTRWRFDGWKIAAASKTVQDGDKFDLTTANGVVAGASDTYSLTLEAQWTQLFTVSYAAGGHGTVGTNVSTFVNKPAGKYTTLQPSVAIPEGTGESWNGANTYFTDASGHWKFLGWQDQDGTDRGANTEITVSKDLTLTAQWEKTYKVTLGAPILAGTATALGTYSQAKFNATPVVSGTNGNFVWVKAGGSVGITDLALGSGESNYIFAQWTQTSATPGTFTNDATGSTKADTFTPEADTTLTPNYWLKPSLSPASDWYHLNFDMNATVNKPTCPVNGQKNELPTYVWTKNSATLDTPQIEIKIGGTWTALTVGSDATADVIATTDGSGNVTYVFQDAYLKNQLTVPAGQTSATYDIRVNSHTPNNGAGTANKEDTVREAKLVIYVNPDPLKKVDIWAINHVDTTTTANVNASTGRNGVDYKTHDPLTIEKDNKLTYTWYYGPTKATQSDYSSASPANNATNVTNATNNLPGDKALLSSVETTVTDGASAPVTQAALKGKYIYAVVAASGTGYGAVITNSIAVDYDAVVKVQKDGTAVAVADKGNYSVYLVPHKADNAATYATLPAGNVEAKAKDGLAAGLYQTDDSALTGGVTYDVYANKVEGNKTIYVKVPGLSVSTQINADAANPPTVNFYSVNAVGTAFDHAEADGGVEVPEDFATTPGTKFTTAGAAGATIDVDSTKGVLNNTTVTAAANAAWTQDYLWNWGEDHTSAAAPTLSYGTDHQTSGNATQNYTITAKSWIGGELEQKVYTIVGDIKGSGGEVDKATLSVKNGDNTYTFTGAMTNGQPGDKVTFKVPKSSVAAGAIHDDYLLTATGAADPRTTIRGYSVPSKSDPDGVDPMKIETVAADGTDKFTIFIDASTWQLKVEDDHKQNALLTGAADIASVSRSHTSPVTDPTKVQKGDDTTAWTKTFANYAAATDQLVYNVTVSNPGNTELTVSLVVKKTAGGTTTTIFDSTTALTTDTNNVAFADLAASFDLAAKTGATEASKAFKVTIPENLDNNDDVTYSFEFTSVDKKDNTVLGPSLTYNLGLTVNPIPVKSVAIDAKSDGTFAAKDLTFDATNAPLDSTAPTLTTANDLTYQWYVGTKPTVAADGTVTAGTAATGTGNATATYTPAPADGGKDLWLVVSGHDNASKYAMASVKAPYQAAVTILENTTATTDYGDYKVYLVPTSMGDTQPTNWTATGIVEATHKSGDAQGVFTTDGAKLAAGTTYNVWTNVVKGAAGDGTKYKNSGALSAINDDGVATKTVTYYSVTINETTYDNQYAGLKGTDFFGTGAAGTTAAPQTGTLTGTRATALAGATAVANGGWVIAGTDVDFAHTAWNKDYTLAWTGAAKEGVDAAGGGSAAKATINANTTVDAELTLTLYKVTAYATGKGEALYISMTSTGDANANVFTTKTDTPDANAIVGISGGSKNSVNAGSNVVFQVPKGAYTVSAPVDPDGGTTRLGYRETHAAAALIETETFAKNVNADDNYDVVLSSAGIGLKVVDDDTPGDPHEVSDVWQSGDAKPAKDTTHTQTLEYGYNSPVDILLTVKNNSSAISDTDTGLQTVYEITAKGEDPDASGVIWDSTTLKADGSAVIDEMADGATEPTVKLTIPKDLEAGTYNYKATFTFSNAVDGEAKGTLVYNLKIVVNPAEFATVTMKYDGAGAAIDTTKVLEAGKDLALNSATTTVNNVYASLTGGTDYHYAWYASADNSIVKADLAWNDANGTVSVSGKTATAIGTADMTLDAATIAGHQSEYIYLVIYATASNGKVIEAAVSAPVRAGYQGVVQIKEDGALQTSEPKAEGTAKYTVKIVAPDGTELPTVWSDDLDGYVACDGGNDPIYLDPTLTYTVKTSAYAGAATVTALTGASIKGDNLAGQSHIATAEYFTVTAVATKAEHYVAAVGEAFTAMPKAKLTIGGVDVDTKTVLKGQNVDAKFEAVDSGKAWTQDYKLTWQDKKDNAADGTSLDDTALTDTATSAVTGQTWSNITAKTYIGGRLDQNVYEITGSIVGTGSLTHVVMTDGNAKANTTVKDGTINKNNSNKITDVDNNGTAGNAGDKITLFVVKGQYALDATAATGTTVRGIEWAGGAFEPGASVNGKDVPTGTTFTVYLDAASSVLRVQDIHATPDRADSDAKAPASNFKHADHKHEVYFSAMTGDDTQTVELENRGNTALTLDEPTIWKVNDGAALANVKWADWTNANPVTALGTNGAYSEADVITITNQITDANKTLGAATPNASGVLGNFKKVTAATVTVSQNVDVADSGIYIIRYTTGENGPVVYYVLNLVVKQLPIAAVTTDTPAGAPGAGDKVQLEGATDGTTGGFDKVMVDDDGNTTTAAVAASAVADPALADGTDVKYQWVKAKTQLTPAQVKAALKVDASGVSATASTVSVLVGNGADSKQYTVQSGDVDSFLYLVAYAPKDTVVNTTDFAVSAAIKTKETKGVQVSLDGTVRPISGHDQPFGADGLVEIYLLEDGKTWADPVAGEGGSVTLADGAWPTTWSNDNNKLYQAAVDMNKTYHVYAPTYLGSTHYVDTGLTVGTGVTTVPVVPYWSVEHTANVTVKNTYDGFAAYLPDSTQTGKEDNAIQNALSVKVSATKGGTDYTDTLTGANVPVLEGMKVQVTVDADASSANTTAGVKKSWSQTTDLHTMTAFGWQDGTATAGAGVKKTGITYPAGSGDPATHLVRSGDITVNAQQNFTAQLDQSLFDVQFIVKDNTPAGTSTEGFTPGVRSASLTATEPGVTLTLSHKSITDPANGANGAKVLFEKVPVGAFEIKAVGQNRTSIDGYTWNATDLSHPVTPGKIVNVAGGATPDDTNKHTGNTIQIQYSSNSIKWQDNFDVTNGKVLADNRFVDSDGFEKVNTPTTGPWLALKDGYTTAGGDVLKYTVRVVNNGVMPLDNFQIKQTVGTDVLNATLSAVRVFDGTTGAQKTGADATADVTKVGFTLLINDWVEFDVEIPEGKAPSGTNYASHFEVSSSNQGNIAGGTYDPAYQVRPVLEFQPGGATVLYGGNAFETTPAATDISSGWQTSYGTEPTFAYDVLTEAELTAYLGGAARPANVYTKDQKPDWLLLDGATGQVTFDSNLRATDVNVQSTAANFTEYLADPTKRVNNEVVLYIKAVDAANNETYYTTYTVDVEPGTLQIVGDAFAPATAYIGQSVDKGAFTYTNVTNQISEDVVAAGDIAGTGNNTANGNTAAKDGWVTTGTDKTPTASWSVDPTLYAKDQNQYTFTVTYKKDTAAEKWNYKPASVTKTITPQKPPMDLKFSDTLTKASYEPAGAEVLVGLGSDYSDNVPNTKPEYAPGILNLAEDAFRTGEHIVYLDVEPRYNVTLTGVGDIYGVKVEKKLVGFSELDSTLSFTNDEFHEVDGKTKTFALELTPMPGTTGKYVGVHTAEYIVTGYSSAAEAAADPNREHPGVKATYTLSIEVTPKVIAQAHVTDLDDPQPGKTPDTTITITAKDPEGEEIKPVTPDKHDNTPMDPKVTWTDPQGNPVDPTKPFEDGKDYKVTVELPVDPNYTFKDQKQPEEIPNYTLNGKTDVNDDPALEDETLTVWVTTENDPPVPDRNKQVTFEKTTDLPKFAHLEFEDVNADDEADHMPHAVHVNRPTITVQRGDALGKYIISLGAYDNAVSPVELTQVNGLPAGAVWSLTPASIDRLDDVTATPAGEKQSYVLDLSGVYTVDLDAKLYTLELTATGKDANYPDRDVTPATYKMDIRVTPADPSELMFKDLRKTGTGDGTTNAITPAENVYAETYTRVITVKWDKTKGGWYPLGTYNIDLGAFTNNVRDLALNSTGTITSDSVVKDLSAAIRDFNANQAKLDKDGVWSFALDLSDVDYATLNTDATETKDLEYLELTATGKDLNGTTVKATYKLALKFEVPPKPALKFDDVKQGGGSGDPATTGPEVNDTREITATEGTKLGKYTIYLGAYDAAVKVNSITSTRSPNMIYNVTPDCATVTPVTLVERKSVGDAQAFELDLTGMDTKPGVYTLTLVAQGVDLSGKYTVNASYTLTITIRPKGGGGGGGGGGTSCPNQVTYLLGLYGTTKDATMEMVSGKSVKSVPNVSALEGYKFLGWSLAGPTGNAEQDAKRTLVDPKSVTINGDTTFYAVYQVLYKVPKPPVHKHYVIGYPNGNFGPGDNIDRASVATIIARAVLPNFVEGADYGNPGGYSDVDGHWAESAIAYCSKYGVFKGYDDGTFRPKQPISRQELALVMARLSGVKSGSAPFSDITTAGDWAKDGIYTAYANGWVNGYTDGTFKPLNPIRRDETVKIFNAYLGRGVNAEGLSVLTEYVHTGVASNVTENGTTEYMTWPDVTKDQWAYYEIIEAANDHEFEVDATQPRGYAVPEQWTKCWIDEKWRYHDDANDGGPSAVVSDLTRKFGAAD